MITIEEVKEQIKEILLKNFPKVADSIQNFNEDTHLMNATSQLDSIDYLTLVLEMEKKFAVRLATNDFEEGIWTNLNSLAQAIQERMAQSQISRNKV
jgi:acyl carrier protein